MDTTYTYASAVARGEIPAPVATPAETRVFAPVMEWDVALTRRATARRYQRKRSALRALVAAGVFTPEEARRNSTLTNLRTKWLALKNWRTWA